MPQNRMRIPSILLRVLLVCSWVRSSHSMYLPVKIATADSFPRQPPPSMSSCTSTNIRLVRIRDKALPDIAIEPPFTAVLAFGRVRFHLVVKRLMLHVG